MEGVKMKNTHKVRAAFNEANRERLEAIVRSQGDTSVLKNVSPSFIIMDLTWRCNYECMSCIDKKAVVSEKDAKGLPSVDMPLEIIEDIFDYSKRHNVRGIMTMGGEVFTYDEGIRLALAKSAEFKIPLKTVSNGSHLGKYADLIEGAYKLPGSMLRVSVNAGRNRYHEQTGQITEALYDDVFESITDITTRGVPMFVSTVVFPSSADDSNIDELDEITSSCEAAGISSMIFLPGRDPEAMKRYRYTDGEKEYLANLQSRHGKVKIYMEDVLKPDSEVFDQNLNMPCYAAYLYSLIGSNGDVYVCSDHRGNPDAVLGKLKGKGDFAKFWHSEERVKGQQAFRPACQCKEMTCIKYDILERFDELCDEYDKTGMIPKNLVVSDIPESFF
jgi:MoaA/NifB/PqqE/SkfB family radical SAM enzyme